jgi:alanine dehydrogenase
MQVMQLERVFAYDLNPETAAAFASDSRGKYAADIVAAPDLSSAVGQSDIVISCTPSRQYFITRQDVRPGTFVAAVGADSPDKQEIEPELIAQNKVIADITAQCVEVGDIHHAVEQCLMAEKDVYGDIGEVISGKKSGRQNPDEIIIFDATGSALQDVACAAYVYEKAMGQKIQIPGFDFTA